MRWFAALLLCLIANIALAQNPTCPTRPVGDNSNACASTAFVQADFASNAIVSVTNPAFAGGAKGDCVTDDGPAFNAATATSNTTVTVPNPPGGCYAIATPIVIGNGTWVGIAATTISTVQNVELVGIAGHGGGQNLASGSLDTSGKAIQLKWTGTAAGTPVTISGPGSFALRNLSIDGNSGNAGTTLLLRGLYRSRIENVSVWNWSGTGVRHQSTPTLPAGLFYGSCVNQFYNVTGSSTGFTATAGLDIGGTDLTTGTFDVCRDNVINAEFQADNAGHTASSLILRGADIVTFVGGDFGFSTSKSLTVIPPTSDTVLPNNITFVNTVFISPLSYPDDGSWNCSGSANQGITFAPLPIKILTDGGGVVPTSTRGCIHGFTSAGQILGTNALAVFNLICANTTNGGAQTSFFSGYCGAAENAFNTPVPIAGTLKNLFIAQNVAPTGVQTQTYTLRKNNAGTAITCTVTGAAQTCNDTTHTVTVVAGDTWDVQAVGSATAAATNITGAIQFLSP